MSFFFKGDFNSKLAACKIWKENSKDAGIIGVNFHNAHQRKSVVIAGIIRQKEL